VANPIEDKNNPEFVGDQSKFKYLAIHGYEKFQKDKYGSLGDGSRLWIKDACRKDSDAEYSSLTVVQRYVLDGLRRLTGLHGKWPNNDPLWVVRGLCIGRKERGPCAKAVRTLVELGLVTLSNDKLDSLEEREKKEEKDQKKSVKPVEAEAAKPTPFFVEDVEDPEMTPAVSRPKSQTSITAREPRPGEHAQWLTVYFWELVGSPKHVSDSDLQHQWEPRMAKLLRSYEFDELRGLLQWAIKEDTFWPKLVTNPEKLTKHIEKLSEQFRAWQQLKENQKKAAEKEQAASSVKKQSPANYGGGGPVELKGERIL
jgi:hypothetical protein